MQTFSSVKDVCEQLFALESEHGLLDYEVDGVKLWQYMRMPIYYEISQRLGVFSDPNPAEKSKYRRVREYIEKIKNSFFKNPFFHSSTVDYIVVPHARKKKVDGIFSDVYTESLFPFLKDNYKTYICLESSYRGFHQGCPNDNTYFMDFLSIWSRWRKYILREQLSVDSLSSITEIVRYVEDSFAIKTDLTSLLISGIQNFQSNYSIYVSLFKRLQPKAVYLVVSYVHGDLIKAAHDLSIEVIELQHGTFSKYHLGYSFPKRSEVLEYFPDKFLAWGEYWQGLIELPISKHQVGICGFKHFHDLRLQYGDVVRNERQIVVLSQGAISESLVDSLNLCIDQLVAYQVLYKLHPSEDVSWQQNKTLVALGEKDNVSIIGSSVDLYSVLAESTYQFGVFSTAIYEGFGMGCKTILFDLPGIEYMDALISRGVAVIYDGQRDITLSLEKSDTAIDEGLSEYFFGHENGEFLVAEI